MEYERQLLFPAGFAVGAAGHDAAYVVEDNFKTKEAIIAMIEMII